MLNISKLNNQNKENISKRKILTNTNFSEKNYPNSTREWKNSIYVFNKSALNLIPYTNKVTIKIIKSYFYMYSSKINENRLKEKVLSRFRKLETTRIFVNKGEFKHTNNKVIITLHIFNKQKLNFKKLLKKGYVFFLKNKKKLWRNKRNKKKLWWKRLLSPIKRKKLISHRKKIIGIKNKYKYKFYLKKEKQITKIIKQIKKQFFFKNRTKERIIEHFKDIKDGIITLKTEYNNWFFYKWNKDIEYNTKMFRENLITQRLGWYLFIDTLKELKKKSNKKIKCSKENENENAIKHLVEKMNNYFISENYFNFNKKKETDYVYSLYLLYLNYVQLCYLNKSKFNYTYLQYLTNILEKIYNKNIEFNIVNLKTFYSNSDILSEILTLKIRSNRRNTLRYLKKIMIKVKVHKLKMDIFKTNLNIFNKNNKNKKRYTDNINTILNNNYYIIKNIRHLNWLKSKKLTGVRLEASGRLTRRYTASRSVLRYKYKGNLLNEDSSINKKSSILLLGHQRSNIQYSFIKHKTRIGSFGIKGWVSAN